MTGGLAGLVLATTRVALAVLWTTAGATVCFVLSICRADFARIRVILYRGLCRIFGIVVIVHGEPHRSRPLLIASNHISYLDILALGAVAELEFVSKAEVASWPVIGLLAKLGDTVFIERLRTRTLDAGQYMADRLGKNRTLVFFPEATSGAGNRLLPFKSALFTVAHAMEGITVQPATIAYTRLNGLPIGFGWRAFFAWYGDMPLISHAWRFLQLGQTTVEIALLPPIENSAGMDRKTLAVATKQAVQVGFNRILSGQPPQQ